MDKRESEALKPCPLALCNGAAEAVYAAEAGAYVECTNCGLTTRVVEENLTNAEDMEAVIRLWNTRPAADLEAVKEACAKIAECHPVNDPGERPLNKLAEEAVCEHAARIALRIRSLDLSALSCAGEGK